MEALILDNKLADRLKAALEAAEQQGEGFKSVSVVLEEADAGDLMNALHAALGI